jgi:hypothetical protein
LYLLGLDVREILILKNCRKIIQKEKGGKGIMKKNLPGFQNLEGL